MRKTWFVFWLTLMVFLAFPTVVRANAPTPEPKPVPEAPTPGPTPAPHPTLHDSIPLGTPQPGSTPSPDNASSGSGSVIQYFFDPSSTLKEMVDRLLSDVFRDLDRSLEDTLNDFTEWVWRLATKTPDGGVYSTAAKPFTAVGIALFVPMAVLRLVWHQKHVLTDKDDSLVAVAFDVVTAALMVLGIGPLVDWTAQKTFTLTDVVLGKVGVYSLPQHLGAGELFAAMSNGVGHLLMLGFLLVGGILAVASFAVAFAAVHGMFYILTALGPIVFTVGMLPPLGWLKRLWWMGFGAVILTPFVGAAALGALGLLVSLNFGGDLLMVKYILRMIWLWAAAGLMWSLLFMLTRFTLAAGAQVAGKLVAGIGAAVAGLTTAGALVGSGLGSGAATGGAATVEGGTGGAGGANAAAATSGNPYDTAAAHAAKAGAFEALSRVPLIGGAFRTAAGYHRTLADVARLRGMAEGYAYGGHGASPVAPHQLASEMFSRIVGGEAEYRPALNAVQSKLAGLGIEDPEYGPVMPVMWSETNGEQANLAAGLAALYHREPQVFEGLAEAPERWFEIKARARQLIKEQG